MNNKFWKFALCALLAISVASCNDDSSDDSNGSNSNEESSNSGSSGDSGSSGSGDSTAPVEGASCDYDTYSESCNGGDAYYCGSDNTIKKFGCSEYASEGYACVVIKDGYGEGIDYADCYSADDQCTSVGATTTLCADGSYFSYTYTAKCVLASDGNNYWFEDELIDYCDAYCSEDVEGECGESSGGSTATGNTCDEDSYSMSCTADGDVLYCSDSAEMSFACSDYASAGYSCVSFNNYYGSGINGADCLNSDSECSEEGSKRTVCDSYYGIMYYQAVETCTKGSNGKSYWLLSESDGINVCVNACNADETDCDDQGYEKE